MVDINTLNHYAYRIQWSNEDHEYKGTCLELPGLSWLDDSPTRALAGIQRVVCEAAADMETRGETVPEPLSERFYSGRFMVRIPPEQHRRLVVEAAEQGVSLNRLVAMKLSAR